MSLSAVTNVDDTGDSTSEIIQTGAQSHAGAAGLHPQPEGSKKGNGSRSDPARSAFSLRRQSLASGVAPAVGFIAGAEIKALTRDRDRFLETPQAT